MNGENGGPQSDDSHDLLLAQYKIRSDEISDYIQRQNTQTTRAIVAIAIILAAVHTNPTGSAAPEWLLLFIPVVLGLLVIEWTRTVKFLVWSAGQKYRIEEKLSEEDSLFRWEQQYGGALGTEKQEIDFLPSTVQRVTLSLLVGSLYLGFLIDGYTSHFGYSIFASLTSTLTLFAFVIYTALIGLSCWDMLRVVRSTKDDVKDPS